MKLSAAFGGDATVRDAEFERLGPASGGGERLLAYADTVFYVRAARDNARVACIVTTPELAGEAGTTKGLAVVAAPRAAFYRLHNRLTGEASTPPFVSGIGDGCRIHPTAVVSDRAKIGAGVTLGERVVVRDGVEIGDRTFVDAGTVLGAEGLLYYVDEAGDNVGVRHAGSLSIGRYVTILSHVVVVRAVHAGDTTVVADHAIVGIATNVGHDAWIGRNAVVSSNCVVARGARIEDGVWIGSSAVIREYVRVGAGARVNAGSVVVQDVPRRRTVSGNLAVDHATHLREHARIVAGRPPRSGSVGGEVTA